MNLQTKSGFFTGALISAFLIPQLLIIDCRIKTDRRLTTFIANLNCVYTQTHLQLFTGLANDTLSAMIPTQRWYGSMSTSFLGRMSGSENIFLKCTVSCVSNVIRLSVKS